MRTIGFLTFALALAAVGWLVLADRGAARSGNPTDVHLDLAEGHDESLERLDDALGDAVRNAERALDIASRLEARAAAARRSADDVLDLRRDNEAAAASSEASRLAAAEAVVTARLMRTYAQQLLDRTRAAEFDADVGFDVGGQQFRARLADGVMPIVREEVEGAEVVFRAPAAPIIAAHFYRKLPVSDLPPLTREGDGELADRFIDLFHLPAKIG